MKYDLVDIVSVHLSVTIGFMYVLNQPPSQSFKKWSIICLFEIIFHTFLTMGEKWKADVCKQYIEQPSQRELLFALEPCDNGISFFVMAWMFVLFVFLLLYLLA